MPLNYLSKAGDVLDDVATQQYGVCTAATLAALLIANPGLADIGPILPAGLTIILPEDVTTDAPPVASFSLWD
jgi:phage tail protein X